MFFLLVTSAMIGAYGGLLVVIPLLFNTPISIPTSRSWRSIGSIIAASFLALVTATLPTDPWWSNRLLHAIGGGVLASVVCFLAVRDSNVSLSKLQFFILNFLIVAALGVTNELAEFFLQTYFTISFATSVEDTWLDLTSNCIGTLLAGTVITVFFHQKTTPTIPFHKQV